MQKIHSVNYDFLDSLVVNDSVMILGRDQNHHFRKYLLEKAKKKGMLVRTKRTDEGLIVLRVF